MPLSCSQKKEAKEIVLCTQLLWGYQQTKPTSLLETLLIYTLVSSNPKTLGLFSGF